MDQQREVAGTADRSPAARSHGHRPYAEPLDRARGPPASVNRASPDTSFSASQVRAIGNAICPVTPVIKIARREWRLITARHHGIVTPPLTRNTVPVTYRSRVRRQVAAPRTPDPSAPPSCPAGPTRHASRRTGLALRIDRRRRSLTTCRSFIGVSVQPGAMVLTRTPPAATSIARPAAVLGSGGLRRRVPGHRERSPCRPRRM